MKVKLKANDKKLNEVFDRGRKHRGLRNKPIRRRSSKSKIEIAVKTCGKEMLDTTGELSKVVYIANEPSYRPWKVLKFNLFPACGYNIARLLHCQECREENV